jgi:hypothetical protein
MLFINGSLKVYPTLTIFYTDDRPVEGLLRRFYPLGCLIDYGTWMECSMEKAPISSNDKWYLFL